ncbi:cation:proton antiporter [Sphingomicrobium arenosum]|uniref:cation:proton antiporter n=1 Tax=Sphingomicrobium arenosum TaxID=2233861 RepID=UPI002240EDB7|nr:sodium:proton antiporter [Sphingomicrobium arenosum]
MSLPSMILAAGAAQDAPPVDFTTLGLVIFVATLVAIATRRIGLPYSVGLVIAGFGIALTPIGVDLELTPTLVFELLLPPLLFEAAIQIPWKNLRKELPLLLSLVTVGVVAAAALVAAGMHYLVGWGWLGAMFFGVLIAATDPVSVIATFKENKVDHRLHLLVESESLLNDGVAAVLFALLLGVAAVGSFEALSVGGAAWDLVRIAGGGIVIGLVVSGGLLLVAGRTEDKLVEISLTVLAAYGSFLAAEHFGMSGVLACVAAGIMVGNVGWLGSISDEGRGAVLSFWDYAAFLANSFVFILIGDGEASPTLLAAIPIAAIAVVLQLAGRAVAIYPVTYAWTRSKLAIPWRYKHILFWGGLRGALSLALALSIPESVPERAAIISAAFLVVAFSIFVQGITMPPLLRNLDLVRGEDEGDHCERTDDEGAKENWGA